MNRPFFGQSFNINRILVVDDAPDNLFLVQSILEEEGYEIMMANDGASALTKVEHSPPDLILLDIMMPDIDGFEVTRRIRALPQLPFIPILLITAYNEPSAVQGLDSGADDFIRKPVDINELLARVRSLLRLKHTVDERDRIVRQREDFVSRLTHDLRTPLIAADRMFTLFEQQAFGTVPEPMLEAIAVLTRSNHNLLEMVNTLLEVYRYEEGNKTLLFSKVDIQKVLEEVIQPLQSLAEEKKILLKHNSNRQSEENWFVEGDRLELHRVFTNLIGNAIKFTAQGVIEVNLTQANSQILVTVKDTGYGIATEEQHLLFERFHSGTHQASGSGLGLYLSRCIVETHRGTIQVKSTLGSGSTFTVILPTIVNHNG